jgi:hypothetical protein
MEERGRGSHERASGAISGGGSRFCMLDGVAGRLPARAVAGSADSGTFCLTCGLGRGR